MTRTIIAVIAGLVVGSAVNMGLVMLGSALVPGPAGVDMTDAASLEAGAHLLQPKHFVFPFLAHALGTLAGALTAYGISLHHKTHAAYIIGALFFMGGVAASTMIPAPAWYMAIDLVLAYIPMAFLATFIGPRMAKSKAQETAADSDQ